MRSVVLHVPKEEVINCIRERSLNLLEYFGEVLYEEVFHGILSAYSLFDCCFFGCLTNHTGEDSSPLGYFLLYGDSSFFILALHGSIELLGEQFFNLWVHVFEDQFLVDTVGSDHFCDEMFIVGDHLLFFGLKRCGLG